MGRQTDLTDANKQAFSARMISLLSCCKNALNNSCAVKTPVVFRSEFCTLGSRDSCAESLDSSLRKCTSYNKHWFPELVPLAAQLEFMYQI
jgi:hypothetical protein